MNKYTSYRVDVRGTSTSNLNKNVGGVEGGNTSSNSSSNLNDDVFQNAAYSAVLRRYSDFHWLYERLQKERAGAIVPPLPDKQAVARFSPEFIGERRRQLERFLRRVSVHPELYDAPSLDTFLRADDLAFHAAKSSKGQTADRMIMSIAQPSSSSNNNHPMASSLDPYQQQPVKKDGFKKWFAEAKTTLAGELVRSPDDDLFFEIGRYIDGLEKQMKSVQQQASSLGRKGKEIANGQFEFGLAFTLLGQSEADSLGMALGKVGDAADTLAKISTEQTRLEFAKFEEPLQDYIKTIHAVKLALQRRQDVRITYTTCLSEVSHKQASLHKLRATPGAEAKAYGMEMSLQRKQKETDLMKDEFATVSQRVLREVDRFKREKAEEMRYIVLDYINLQIEYNRKMEEIWSNVIPQLESVQVTDSEGGNRGGDNVVLPPPDNPTMDMMAGNDPVMIGGVQYRDQGPIPSTQM